MSGSARSDVPAVAIFGLCAALTILGSVLGFVVRPDPRVSGVWAAICSAAGFTTADPAARPAASVASQVSWTIDRQARAQGGDPLRGAWIGGNCTACHGTVVQQRRSGAPSLVALGRESIYKEMVDYRDGRRTSPVMRAIASSLSDQDLADVAAWAASRPVGLELATTEDVGTSVPRLVTTGDADRGIGPCAACHGPAGVVPAAPSLFGLDRTYFTQQMLAFAHANRSNDINGQMRVVARPLSAGEIETLAAYYAEID